MDELDQSLRLAEDALAEGNYAYAHQTFEDYLDARPTDERALHFAAEAARKLNNSPYVVEIYRRASLLEPGTPVLRIEWIEALFLDQQTEEACNRAAEAFELFPETLHFKSQIARGEIVKGNFESARKILWECHAADPAMTGPLLRLSQIMNSDDVEPLAEALNNLWARRGAIDPNELTVLATARGKVMERLERYDEAWEAYAFGCSVRKDKLQFSENGLHRNFRLHQHLFGATSPLHRPSSDESLSMSHDTQIGRSLIFIVSLPRAGSTLTEQILASHSSVSTIGERGFAYEAFNLWNDNQTLSPQNKFRDSAFDEARRSYLRAAASVTQGKGAVIVDKTISNFLCIGFLHAMFPGAKFVHVARDPMDTAVSCFTTQFQSGIEWSNDLETTGRMIRRYQKLMRQWIKQWPDDILTIRYEDLVGDTETTARRLLEFCGLDWEPACLDFHKSQSAVATASVVQVRQPIYQSAMGRAAHFDGHLGPLKAAMGRAAKPDWFLKP